MRIKKTGLDYFPLDTDFLQNRTVRRVMKREGDGAFAVLMGVLSLIYSGEGYYLQADPLLYDDLADGLFEKDAADVERIIRLAADYGLFDADMLTRYGILTSRHIQEQFLFCIRRRKRRYIDPRFRLCPEETEEETSAESAPADTDGAAAERPQNVAQTPQNVTQTPKNDRSTAPEPTKQSTEKHSIAQQRKENPLLSRSPESRGTAGAGAMPPGGPCGEEELLPQEAPAATRARGHTWSEADIAALRPPVDGQKRNLDGLKENLQRLRVPLQEQYAIILKSNFGIIGHPVWRGFYTLRESHGKIRQPGRYLLSLCHAGKGKGG